MPSIKKNNSKNTDMMISFLLNPFFFKNMIQFSVKIMLVRREFVEPKQNQFDLFCFNKFLKQNKNMNLKFKFTN